MRRVVIAAFPDCMSLDVVVPAEVFDSAGGYEVEVVAPDPEPHEDRSPHLRQGDGA